VGAKVTHSGTAKLDEMAAGYILRWLGRGPVGKGLATMMEFDKKPSAARADAETVERICALVLQFFEDESKARLWLRTPNPMLGNRSPCDLMRLGRSEKLLRFVIQAIDESAHPTFDDGVEHAWSREVDGRIAQLEVGATETIPWEIVRARLRTRLE
jgi:Protein of unknown function (DUF2384)